MFNKQSDKSLSERQRRIYSFLRHNPVGVLATVTPDGEPHGVVIYYVLDSDINIMFLTKTGTRKYDNLLRNNHAQLIVFDRNTQTTAQITGKAIEVKDSDDINAIAAEVLKISLRSNESDIPPVAKLQAGECTAFKIVPAQIRIASYEKSDSGDYSKIFDSIESFVLKDGLF